MLSYKNRKVFDTCNSLISSGDLKGLENYISTTRRHQPWIGHEEFSLLHLAARHNQPEICEFLLKKGISPNVRESFSNKTPLHIAAYCGHLDVVQMLMDYKAAIGPSKHARDRIGCYPIHYAALGEHKDLMILLLKHHSRISFQSLFGNVLDILIRKRNFELTDFFSNAEGLYAFEPICKYNKNLSISSRDEKEWTPFHSAAVAGEKQIFEMLMSKFPYALVLDSQASDCEFTPSIETLALLEGHQDVARLVGDERGIDDCRKAYLETNWYEAEFPHRKELSQSIRNRDINKLEEILKKESSSFFLERTERTRIEKFFQSLTKPNAYDLAIYLYSLTFFDFIIEKKIKLPEEEFFIWERQKCLFFNWSLIDVHPLGAQIIENMII